ncbi:MAG TPA: hypothetical protein VF519_17755 [Mycobacteriales bacterium]
MERPPAYVSPGGRFRVEWLEHSFVGNTTFAQPKVVDTRDGAVLLDLTGAGSFGWFGWVLGADGAVLELAVRRVQSETGGTVVIDADARTYEIRDAARGGKGLDHVRERLRLGGLAER